MIKTFAIMKKENVFTLVSVVLQQQLETATFEITGATQSHVPERVGWGFYVFQYLQKRSLSLGPKSFPAHFRILRSERA